MGSGELQQDVIVNTFAGGYADPRSVALTIIPPGQSPLMRNIDTSGGSARTMQGFVKAHTNAKTADLVGGWYDFETATTYVAYANRLGKLNVSAGTLDDLSGTSVFTPGHMTQFARLTDYIMVVNGKDAPRLYNTATSTLSTITTPPATWGTNNYPSLVINWMGRFFAVVDSQPDILYYSKLYDPTDWSPGTDPNDGGALRIGEDGRRITALFAYNEQLAVFKELGLYALSGNAKFNTVTLTPDFDQTTFDWQLVYPGMDCVSQRSLVAAYDQLYLWGRTQVWLISTKDISNRIQAEPISAPDIAATVQDVQSDLNQISGVFYPERNQIWWHVKKTGASARFDTTYCFDVKNKKWMIRDGYTHRFLMNAFENGRQVIYGGGYADEEKAFLYKHNSGYTYDGVLVPWTYYSAWLDLGQANSGRTNYVSFMFGAGTLPGFLYSYAYDLLSAPYDSVVLETEAASSTWNTGGGSTWGTGGGTTGTWQTQPTARSVERIFGRGRKIQHRFNGTGFFELLEIAHPSTAVGYN